QPLSDLNWPQRNHLEFRAAPRQLATGSDFEVELIDRDGAKLPDDVKIHFRSVDSESSAPATVVTPVAVADGTMLARRENVTQSFEYRATGGDDDSMSWRRLDVIDPPRAANVDVTLYPPKHTGWAPYSGERRIRAYQGTRVEMAGTLTKPVREVRLHRTGEPPVVANLNDAGDEFKFSEAGPSAVVVDNSTTYWLEFDDLEHQDLVGGRDDQWNMIALTDEKPTVVLEQPSRDVAVVADAVVPLRIVAKDDIRTQAVDLIYRRVQDKEDEVKTVRLMEASLPSAGEPEDAGDQHVVTLDWKLAELGIEPGSELLIYAVAHDFRPQSTKSSIRRIRVVKPADLLEQVASRQAAILSDLARIRQLQIAAREQATSLRIQLEEVGKTDDTTSDRAHAAMLAQQQVDREVDAPTDGVLARIDAALADVKNNHLHRDQMAEQLAEIGVQVRRLHAEVLPAARGRLGTARKTAQEGAAASSPKIVEQLSAADVAQKEVIAVLDKILGKHSEWSGFHQLYRDVSRIKSDQEKILKQTDKLGESTVGRRVSQLDPQQQADLKKLAFAQSQLSRQAENARRQLRIAADKADESGDDSADLRNALADATQLANEENVAARMQDAVKDIAANRIGSATNQQKSLVKSLDELLDVLANRRERRLSRLVEQLRAAERDLQDIAQRQEQLRKRLSDARKEEDTEKKKRELRRLVKEQQDLQKEVEKFARQLRRLQADKAGQSADRAGKRMKAAAQAADSGNAGGAASMAQAATDDLEQAMHELSQRRRAAEMDLAQEQLASLENVLKQLIERQQLVLDETIVMDGRMRENKPREAALLDLASLARRQELLGEETKAAAKRVAALKLVRSTIDRAADQMGRAAALLRRRDAGADVHRAQREALRQLGYVMSAVNPDEKKSGGTGSSPAGGDGGSQSGGGSAMNVAELRLVAIVQEQLIVRTGELEKQRVAGEALTPVQEKEFEELQSQQAELADWIFRLSEPDESGPEDRSEEFLPNSPNKEKDEDPESIDELLPSLFGDE
ncbi:MAG: hypothetical protein MI757_05290, partial [Pirellulales bacterium]|nr:hypothetical protein [Pirellulales bacterium]